jgi:competence protein ComEC
MMNNYVERMNTVSFAVWEHLYLSIPQTLLLLAFIAAAAYWLMEQNKTALKLALTFLFAFVVLRTISFLQVQEQKKLIVYNVPRHQAIDLVDGRNYLFIGDTALEQNEPLRQFHLQPSRIQHRVQPAAAQPAKAFTFYNKKILVVDAPIQTKLQKELIHVLVLSKNPRLYVHQLAKAFSIRQIVIDGSVPAWKARLWKRDCAQLRIPCHDVTEKGAFVMSLQ